MPQAEPLFSVITVCRNTADNLWLTASSVLAQQLPDSLSCEFIIVDGASTDSTPQVLSRITGVCPANVCLRIVSEPDRGIYDAMNKGVRLASGRLLCFMNAGDTFAGGDVLARMAEVEGTTAADVFYGSVIQKKDFGLVETRPRCLDTLRRKMAFCHQSTFTRREALLLHPYDLRFRLTADYEFFFYCYGSGMAMHDVGFPIAVFESENGISSRNRLRMNREYARINGRRKSPAWWVEYTGKCLEVGFNHIWRTLSPEKWTNRIRKSNYSRKMSE